MSLHLVSRDELSDPYPPFLRVHRLSALAHCLLTAQSAQRYDERIAACWNMRAQSRAAPTAPDCCIRSSRYSCWCSDVWVQPRVGAICLSWIHDKLPVQSAVSSQWQDRPVPTRRMKKPREAFIPAASKRHRRNSAHAASAAKIIYDNGTVEHSWACCKVTAW